MKVELGKYGSLFNIINTMASDNKNIFKALIIDENEFKASLDGLLTGLSDLDKEKGRVIAVLTEFQVGGGGRIDIMIQVVDEKDENSISVGLELKYGKSKLEEAESQIKKYAEGKNIKSITEGNRVAFIGVVFDQNSSDKLISTSEKFVVADVAHSSLTGAGCSNKNEPPKQGPGNGR